MPRQLTFDDITEPEYVKYDNEAFENKSIAVICGSCGAGMKGGPQATNMNEDNDMIGQWIYTCRVCGDCTANLFITKDEFGVDTKLGPECEALEITESELTKRTVENEKDGEIDEITAYFYEPYFDPSGWEEPEE